MHIKYIYIYTLWILLIVTVNIIIVIIIYCVLAHKCICICTKKINFLIKIYYYNCCLIRSGILNHLEEGRGKFRVG